MKCRRVVMKTAVTAASYWSQRNGSRVPVRALCGHIVATVSWGSPRQAKTGIAGLQRPKRAENNWRKRSGVARSMSAHIRIDTCSSMFGRCRPTNGSSLPACCRARRARADQQRNVGACGGDTFVNKGGQE
jgi:hypothetical protein